MFNKVIAIDLASTNSKIESVTALKTIFGLIKPAKNLLSKNTILLSNILKSKDKFYFVDSGRTALSLILQSLNFKTGSEVMFQGFTCIVVPNSILAAKLKPVTCDIANSNYNIDLINAALKITSKTKVLIIQHTFGQVCNMTEVLAFVKKYKLILIEDCAHALGSEYHYKNKTYSCGSLGDFAIYSFARDKNISTGIGGVIRVNKVIYDKEIGFLCKNLKPMTKVRELKTLGYIILCNYLIKPFYNFFSLGKAILFVLQASKILEKYYTKNEIYFYPDNLNSSKYSDKLACILYSQLKSFETSQSQRIKISAVYSNILNMQNVSQNNFRFIINLQKYKNHKEIYQNILFKTKKQSILLGTMYSSVFIPGQSMNHIKFEYFNTPIAIAKSDNCIINLPTHQGVSVKDAKKIAFIIKNELKASSESSNFFK